MSEAEENEAPEYANCEVHDEGRPEHALPLCGIIAQSGDLIRSCTTESELEDSEVAEHNPNDRQDAVAIHADAMEVKGHSGERNRNGHDQAGDVDHRVPAESF